MGLREQVQLCDPDGEGPEDAGVGRGTRRQALFQRTTQTQDEANKIWDAIKTIPDWTNEIVADIKATGARRARRRGRGDRLTQ